MTLGTHNSATGGQLLWWLRPLAWVEGTNYYPTATSLISVCIEEHYWTLDWGKMYGKTWKDKLPLPKRHAKKFNAKYKSECKSECKKEYLMLDFYELG